MKIAKPVVQVHGGITLAVRMKIVRSVVRVNGKMVFVAMGKIQKTVAEPMEVNGYFVIIQL